MSTDETTTSPVYVIESIPVAGDSEVTPAEARREGIPTPDHLRVFRELGRGAMGRVHPATDRNLLRHVAMKRLDASLARVPMYRDGFVAEAQITGQLEHPNIVPVHELAVDERGVPYFTMKLVQGETFADWLRDPSRPPGSAERLEDGLEIFLKVCDAVAYAHHRGVVHRDLKPDNVMVAEFGQVYLMDWGLARLTRTRPHSGARSVMETPGPVGTPGYMSPEQAAGDPSKMDERTDVFGLGAILYELATGRLPYPDAVDATAAIDQAREGRVVPIDEAAVGLGLPKRLRDLVTRAVAPRPEDRFASVVELQRALRSFLRGGLHLPRRVFEPGELIIVEGDDGDEAYLIVGGKCRAFRTVGERREVLAEMGPGDVFGEISLLLSEPRAASVVATERTVVLVLDQRTMDEHLGSDAWSGALVRALAQRFWALENQVRSSGLRRRAG
ncbi:protein kinase [Myxococcota bacterium]|nr:protein kinase [Myxococcota bacterium]